MIYEITGETIHGKRFKHVTSNYMQAMSINLYKGSVWQKETPTSPRKLIKRVFN